jgi:DNA polymerase III sliding clamp (beta) subunit (PCNA family)
VNITVDRDHLKAALARTKPAVGRNGLPVLTGVRIDPDAASLTTTNLDLAITTELDTDGTGDPIVVPHERLAALVGSCPDGTVTLEADADELTVTAGHVTAHLRLLPLDGWPQLPAVEGEAHKLSPGDWAGIGAIQFARAADSGDKLANCEIAGGNATTCDHYRLATRSGIDPALDVVLPGHLIDAVVATKAPEVELTIGVHWFHLRADLTTWSAVRPDDGYVTWANLIPADRPVRLAFERDAVLEALGTVSSVGIDADTSKDAVVVFLDVGPEGATLTARHREIGDVTVALDVEASGLEGSFWVAFNATYLTAALRSCAMSTVRLEGVDDKKPWIITEAAVRLLIMPFRVPAGARP